MSITGPDRKGRAGKQDEVEDGLGQDEEVQNSHSYSGSSRQLPMEPCMEPRRDSVFPPQWRITHSSRQLAQVLASGLSLIAFILLLVMLFSKKWLCLSKSRFYQRWPTNVSKRIYTSAHLMSMGPLQICKSKSCSNSENGKGETLQPLNLTLGLQPALASTSAPLYSRPSFWPSPVYWPARWSLALRLPRIISPPQAWPNLFAGPNEKCHCSNKAQSQVCAYENAVRGRDSAHVDHSLIT